MKTKMYFPCTRPCGYGYTTPMQRTPQFGISNNTGKIAQVWPGNFQAAHVKVNALTGRNLYINTPCR